MLYIERFHKAVKSQARNVILTGEQRLQGVQNVGVKVQATLDDGMCIARLTLKPQLRGRSQQPPELQRTAGSMPRFRSPVPPKATQSNAVSATAPCPWAASHDPHSLPEPKCIRRLCNNH